MTQGSFTRNGGRHPVGSMNIRMPYPPPAARVAPLRTTRPVRNAMLPTRITWAGP